MAKISVLVFKRDVHLVFTEQATASGAGWSDTTLQAMDVLTDSPSSMDQCHCTFALGSENRESCNVWSSTVLSDPFYTSNFSMQGPPVSAAKDALRIRGVPWRWKVHQGRAGLPEGGGSGPGNCRNVWDLAVECNISHIIVSLGAHFLSCRNKSRYKVCGAFGGVCLPASWTLRCT